MGRKKILLGLTTMTDWRSKVAEINEYRIEEIALFPTAIVKKERGELCRLLEGTSVKNIPHVHLRNDMDIDELEYFIKRYKTEIFNIHPQNSAHSFVSDYSKYASIIYVENIEEALSEEELNKCGGICVDFSHWEDNVLRKNPAYSDFLNKVKKFKVGCSHISAIKKEARPDEDPTLKGQMTYTDHTFKDLSEFDYIKKYINYLPDLISIELENPIKEQIKVREYLEKLIGKN